jgi:hypothetical protein
MHLPLSNRSLEAASVTNCSEHGLALLPNQAIGVPSSDKDLSRDRKFFLEYRDLGMEA